jgi:hypothetical protein
VELDGSGRIVALGHLRACDPDPELESDCSHETSIVARFTAAGDLDPSFGPGGSGFFDSAASLAALQLQRPRRAGDPGGREDPGGRQHLKGYEGRNVYFGGAGDDLLAGGHGPDLLYGGPGADRLIGGRGYDRLFGGPGADEESGEAAAAASCLPGARTRPVPGPARRPQAPDHRRPHRSAAELQQRRQGVPRLEHQPRRHPHPPRPQVPLHRQPRHRMAA